MGIMITQIFQLSLEILELDGLRYLNKDLHPAHVTYHFFHWKKGTPFAEDQGIYNRLTWWEQIDNGKQLTRNRKFLTVVPVVLKVSIMVRLLRIEVSNGLLGNNGICVGILHRKLGWQSRISIYDLLGCHVRFLKVDLTKNDTDSPFVYLNRYLIASHTTDYQHPMLFFNTLAVIVLVIAKFPNMHKVRIFGINADH
ncbi:hypothetical protein CK203_028749 [Vitis vinifera]|uniref:Uncharacterized protein n=1 Tax=Vitis vinifera TaxID=29760 RepID=A0A438IF51_VITVI|nr:hypothetical protein CK203_028749 [Vitis vinifera]